MEVCPRLWRGFIRVYPKFQCRRWLELLSLNRYCDGPSDGGVYWDIQSISNWSDQTVPMYSRGRRTLYTSNHALSRPKTYFTFPLNSSSIYSSFLTPEFFKLPVLNTMQRRVLKTFETLKNKANNYTTQYNVEKQRKGESYCKRFIVISNYRRQ